MKKTYPPDFEEFWQLYPRKRNVSKSAAFNSFNKVLDSINSDDLIFAAECFAAESKHKEERFLPHPTTWLNQRRWETLESFKNRPTEYPDDFQKIWREYPKQNGSMLKAFQAYNKALDEIFFEEMLMAVRKYNRNLKAVEIQYAPDLARWIREKMWETA